MLSMQTPVMSVKYTVVGEFLRFLTQITMYLENGTIDGFTVNIDHS